MEPPVLTDGEVVLRGLTAADAAELVARCQDPDVVEWTAVPVPYRAADADAFITRAAQDWVLGSAFTFAVDVGERPAGQLTIGCDGKGAGDVSYLLSPWARSSGVMSRALRLAARWGFDGGGLDVLHWRCPTGNWPARRVAWACGFRVEGTVRGLLPDRGRRRDAWVGSLRRGDPLHPVTRWFDLPRLESGSIVLRPNTAQDVQRILEGCSDPCTQLYLPELPSPYTAEDARWYVDSRAEQLAAGLGLYWAVADAEDDQLQAQVGLMGLTDHGRTGEIGYWAHPEARGGGMISAAVRLVARHGLLPEVEGGLGLARVHLRVAEVNEASTRVARSAGFTLVGRDRRGERLRDGTVTDFLRFDLLPEEMEQMWVHPSALR